MLLSQQLVMVSVHISCITSTAHRADVWALGAQGYFAPQCVLTLHMHTVVTMTIHTLFILFPYVKASCQNKKIFFTHHFIVSTSRGRWLLTIPTVFHVVRHTLLYSMSYLNLCRRSHTKCVSPIKTVYKCMAVRTCQ